jgi:hypothetical protein
VGKAGDTLEKSPYFHATLENWRQAPQAATVLRLSNRIPFVFFNGKAKP